MKFSLRIWRQPGPDAQGSFADYEIDDVSESSSFLEMMDTLNEQLTARGEEPVAFDSDCREGICGMCSMVIDGRSHGPQTGAATCQLYMRHFEECLMDDKKPLVDEIEGAKCISVCAAAWKSIESGQPEKVFNDF